jgi:hypothetical protein
MQGCQIVFFIQKHQYGYILEGFGMEIVVLFHGYWHCKAIWLVFFAALAFPASI